MPAALALTLVTRKHGDRTSCCSLAILRHLTAYQPPLRLREPLDLLVVEEADHHTRRVEGASERVFVAHVGQALGGGERA